MAHDVRDQIVDFARRWSEASGIGAGRFVRCLGITGSKFYDRRIGPVLKAIDGASRRTGAIRGPRRLLRLRSQGPRRQLPHARVLRLGL